MDNDFVGMAHEVIVVHFYGAAVVLMWMYQIQELSVKTAKPSFRSLVLLLKGACR
jgi:hypothetical protein